ncbi:Zinc finger CCCH domain-containing protein 11 [Glycine max]|nr:Zinc finger CCCH domain-containing protein 11 [Glycine max]
MPPKQQSKADLVKKQKIVEDKTFGLKNKNRSKNVQKYVQNLKQYVQPKLDPSKLTAKKKKEEKAKDKELNDLFKIAVSQPKCTKGFKCKFSHDLNVQRKGEKLTFIVIKTMEDWDQDTLEKVVESKKTEYNQNKPTDMALLEEESEKITIEEEIENQRAKVTTTTPMTPELFMQWKKKKMEEREANLGAQQAERAKNVRMRYAILLHNRQREANLCLTMLACFVDDDEAYDKYQREPESESGNTEQNANGNATEDGPGTSIASADVDDTDDVDGELDMDELDELSKLIKDINSNKGKSARGCSILLYAV